MISWLEVLFGIYIGYIVAGLFSRLHRFAKALNQGRASAK
jgi:hypothetical protein